MAKKKLKYKALGQAISGKRKSASGFVTIEGYANKYIIDSIGDLMEPGGCKFGRFEKNPIMFFNHDRDYPIGKFLSWEARPEGLWVKGRISNSQNPKIAFVRDLIEEGILATFSIGYEERRAESQADGSRKITDWNLHEVSVVSIPMNEASTFTAARKSFLDNAVKSKRFGAAKLMVKGAWVAGAVNERLEELRGTDGFDEEASMESIATAGGCDREELKRVLAGEVTPVPEKIVAALASTLGIDAASLAALAAQEVPPGEGDNEGDGEGEENPSNPPADGSNPDPEGDDTPDPEDDDEDDDSEDEPKGKQASMVPEDSTPLDTKPPADDNPMMRMMEGVVALLTRAVSLLEGIDAKLPAAQTQVAPNQDASQTQSQVPKADEGATEEAKAALERTARMLDSIEQKVNRLTIAKEGK